MLYRNKKTGCIWDINAPAVLKMVKGDPETFERVGMDAPSGPAADPSALENKLAGKGKKPSAKEAGGGAQAGTAENQA